MKAHLLFLAALAFAAIIPTAAAGSYVTAYGGLNFDNVLNHPAVTDSAGAVVGGTIGTSVDSLPGIRVEADISFRQNDVDIGPFGPFTINASHETFALMGNAVWDVPVTLGPVQPYALLGAGYAHTEGIFENLSVAKVEASGFAWQIGTGLNVAVTDGVTLGIGYRYQRSPELQVFGAELSNGVNHAALIEARIALD